MDTGRMLEALLGGRGGAQPGRGGLEALLGGLAGSSAAPGRMPAGQAGGVPGGAPGGAIGGSLADLLGSLAGGGGRPGGGADAGSGVPGSGGVSGGVGGLLGGLLGGLTGGGTGARPGGIGGMGGMGGLPAGVGGAAAGGLLGALLGGGRSGGGSLVRIGGMAMLGLLAHRAFEQWKAQQAEAAAASGSAATTPPPAEFGRAEAPDAAGKPFGLSLVRAMVAAARADGVIDAAEHERIFAEAEKLEFGPAEKGEMFAILRAEADPEAIARLAGSPAQGAELYIASAMVMGTRNSAERAYLDALAHHLGLAGGLRATLDAQLREAAELEEQMADRPA